MKSDPSVSCALCQLKITKTPILENVHAFCCLGCRAVFNILSSKNQLDQFEKHPIFLQALQSGLISNPDLFDHIQKEQIKVVEGEKEKLYLEIRDMWCPSCAEIIQLMLGKEKGVIRCIVDYTTDLAAIEFSPRYISKSSLISLIKSLGYEPLFLDSAERTAVSRGLFLRLGIAAFCSLNIMMLAYPLYATYFDSESGGVGFLFALWALFMSLPVLLYSGWPIWQRFYNSMKTGMLGMETLVVLGVSSSFFVSVFDMIQGGTRVYFDSMAVIITFVLLGKIIESKAKFSAKETLIRLSRSTPRRGRRRQADGSFLFVPIKEIAIGDCLIAYQGERIVLDGVVVEGNGACDESLMTGESLPVRKNEGDILLSATIVVQGNFVYRVTNNEEESTLRKIIQMIEKDIGNKSVYIRAADKIIAWFVPSVIGIAFFTGVFYALFPNIEDLNPNETLLMRVMAVLLISCPCAIGIAAPAAESYLLNSLAAMGVIVRNRGVLPYLGKEDIFVFDKTGTVTEGMYTIRKGLDFLNKEEKEILHALATPSTHPTSCAIAKALTHEGVKEIIEIEEVIGFGMKGYFEGHCYLLGSARFMALNGVNIPLDSDSFIDETSILSSLFFSKNKTCLTTLFLGDQIRESAQSLIKYLSDQLEKEVFLLSGDSEFSVAAVARASGFKSWKSGCTPLEKREFIEDLKERKKVVCMIGDGINDAPSLTAAHIGISMMSATDMSIQVSDILLTTEDLFIIQKMRALAVKGIVIIRQNLFWAFFYNVIGIALAVFGVLSPIFAAFAMSISSVTVLFNARRLIYTPPSSK